MKIRNALAWLGLVLLTSAAHASAAYERCSLTLKTETRVCAEVTNHPELTGCFNESEAYLADQLIQRYQSYGVCYYAPTDPWSVPECRIEVPNPGRVCLRAPTRPDLGGCFNAQDQYLLDRLITKYERYGVCRRPWGGPGGGTQSACSLELTEPNRVCVRVSQRPDLEGCYNEVDSILARDLIQRYQALGVCYYQPTYPQSACQVNLTGPNRVCVTVPGKPQLLACYNASDDALVRATLDKYRRYGACY